MAGEFEEPFAISFQADVLHSGSVSFGRFEKEDLAWERRSSFSHNRYLEEVEKYSKPGSVVEKKAYFEAHFKKKGVLLPDASGFQYGREHRDSSNEDHEENDDQVMGAGSDCCSDTVVPTNNGGFWSDYEATDSNYSGRYDEAECEVVGSGKDDGPVEAFLMEDDDDHGSVESVIGDLQQAEACRSMRDDSVEAVVGGHDHVEDDDDQVLGAGSDGCSDTVVTEKNGLFCGVYGGGSQIQSSTGSNYSGRYEECEAVGSGKSDDPVEASLMENDDDHGSVESVVEDLHQAEACRSTSDETCRTNDRLEEDAASQNQSSRTTAQSTKRGNARSKVVRMSASQRPLLSPKTRAATERTPSKSSSNSHVSGSRTLNVPVKIQNCREGDRSQQRMKVEKQLSERPLPTKSPLLRVPQKEQSAKRVPQPSNTEISEKEAKLKKDAISQFSGQKEANTKLHQTENRHKQAAGSNDPSAKPNPNSPGFSFKSEERAERRRQFYTKLEEKLHAKEAEMNQIQARTQEKTEAEMRRFRQSLNFKATPMPSFYHHPTQQVRGGNKAVTSNPRLAKQQNKSASQRKGNAKPQPSHKAANKPVSVRESTTTLDDLSAMQMTSDSAELRGCRTSLTSDDSIREAATKAGFKGKKGPENVNDQSSRHVQVSGKNIDMTRTEMAEGKQNAGARRSSRKMASKSTNPGFGHRVIGVTS